MERADTRMVDLHENADFAHDIVKSFVMTRAKVDYFDRTEESRQLMSSQMHVAERTI
jgi:hypothetical protein